MSDLELFERRLCREREARKAAELLLEQKSLEVYQANEQLRLLAIQLRDQGEQTKAIVETAAEGIITYDASGKIALFNRSAARLFGCASIVDGNVRELFEMNPPTLANLFPVKSTIVDKDACECLEMEPEVSFECVGLRPAGKTFIADVAVSRTVIGTAASYTALVRDLSRRKMLEARLSQAQKMESVGQLAAGIAHEINTPIQFVGDNLQFLKGAFDDIAQLIDLFRGLTSEIATSSASSTGSTLKALIDDIHHQSELVDLPFLREEFPNAITQSLDGIERVAKIVRAMKEFSQPASEALSAVDINRTIETTLAVMANQFRESVTVETSLDRELPPVACLAGQLNQSLLNLVTNAVEAIVEHGATQGGRLWISTRREGDSVEIRIRDNGPGIPPEIQNRIFEPFFTTKEVGKGSGQGLAFVYDVIVNKHEGTIHAFSPTSGGTTFVVRLPLTCRSLSKRWEHVDSLD